MKTNSLPGKERAGDISCEKDLGTTVVSLRGRRQGMVLRALFYLFLLGFLTVCAGVVLEEMAAMLL